MTSYFTWETEEINFLMAEEMLTACLPITL